MFAPDKQRAAAGIETQARVRMFRHRSAARFADVFLTSCGPGERAAAKWGDTRRDAFRADLAALATAGSVLPADRSVAIHPTYLAVRA